jgi:hypothetical protein
MLSLMIGVWSLCTKKNTKSVNKVHAQNLEVGYTGFPQHHLTKQTLIEAIIINYGLLPKSSLDICFHKLITNLRLLVLINHVCKIMKTNAKKRSFEHKVWNPRSHNTPSSTGVVYQYDEPNGAKRKIIPWLHLSISQVCHVNQLHRFRLASPTFVNDILIFAFFMLDIENGMLTNISQIQSRYDEILTAVIMKMAVVWVVAPCNLVWVYQRFRGLYCLHHQGDDRPDDGGSTDFWNVGKLMLVYMALQPRRQPSSRIENDYYHRVKVCTISKCRTLI